MQSLKDKTVSALRPLERILKFDVIYLTKGGFWTTLSFSIGTLASVVSMIAFGNLLPRETYGVYNYLLSLGATLSFLTLSGAGIGAMRAVARGHENVVPYALRLQLKYNTIAVAMVLTAALYYGYKGNNVFSYSLALLALTYPIGQAFHTYVQVLTGKKRFDLLTKINGSITIVGTFATVMTLLVTSNILVLVLVYTCVSFIPNIIAYSLVSKGLDKTAPNLEQVKELRRTAFHMTGAGLIGSAVQYFDKIIIFQVAGPASLAIYAFATAGPERLKGLIKGWLSITLPNLAQRSLKELRESLYLRLFFSAIVGTCLFVVYFLLAPYLFKFFLPRYLDAVLYSQVLGLCLIPIPITVYIASIFSSQNMLRANYALSVGTQVIRIILFLLLGWFWQLWGIIIAFVLSTTLHAIYALIIWEIESRRLIKTNE